MTSEMTSEMTSKLYNHTEYTVGWVCALPKEQTAATAMLDRKHPDLPKPPNDHNTYTLGSVGNHNVVIACLPKGKLGNNASVTIVTQMVSTFPSIKFGLMVGIGGGIPSKVRLGDIVVSTPVAQFPGVVQWDFGKAKEGGEFERTGFLNNPPITLLTAVTKLETEYELNGSKIPEYLEEMAKRWPRLAPKYLRSDSLEDILFERDYKHVSRSSIDSGHGLDDGDEDQEEENCRFCDRSRTVKRKTREMRVHYGLIASGNQVIKDAIFRDGLNKRLGGNVLCVELEAAGLMDNFPCIVIRGICDYADSHKNKNWQEYAAAVAAAFAKELLGYVQPSDVEGERTAIDILSQVLDTGSKTGANAEAIRSKLDKKEDLEILDWLTPINYGPQQSDYIKRRQEGTGHWLLHSAEFQMWLGTAKQTLFCPGIPGSGKTILASIVIEELNTEFKNNTSFGIAYLYCNFKRNHEQKAEDLLASLLKQLSQEQSYIYDSVRAVYERHKNKYTRPSLDEISRALQSVTAMYSRIFIIVDALDECEATECRMRFLPELFNLQAKTGVNLFSTSRINDEIATFFVGSLTLKIRAFDEDIETYLKGQMPLLKSDILDDGIRDIILTEIIKAVDGMFLLAVLHMNTLLDLPTKGDVKQALQNLKKGMDGLDEIYKQAMERIEDQRKRSRELAKQILAWIIHAQRPLSTKELQHALAVKPNTTKLNSDYLPSIKILGSLCAGLVTVDEEAGIIRLVHYTTQEYFERTQRNWFPNAEAEITTICVTYLSFSGFEIGVCQTDNEFEERLQLYQLYDYASHNWGHHARKASIACHGVIQFLQNRVQVEASSQGLMAVKRWSEHREYSQEIPKQMTGLHLAAYFGVDNAIRALSNNSPDMKDSYGQTPLSWAAQNGHEAVVKLLLATGQVNIDLKDESGQTPLLRATEIGNDAVVELLLDNGANSSIESKSGWTLLELAVFNRYERVERLLVIHGAPEPEDFYGLQQMFLVK